MRLEGVSAVDKFVPLLAAVADLERSRGTPSFTHPAYGDGDLVAPISVGRVTLGDWPSTVPEALVAEGRFGVLPGESLDDARSALEAAIVAAADDDEWLAGHRPVGRVVRGPVRPGAHPARRPARGGRRRRPTRPSSAPPSPVHGVPYGSDLRFFTNDAVMPAVLYGPGDVAVAHTVDEQVDLDEVFAAAEVVALTLLGWGARANDR